MTRVTIALFFVLVFLVGVIFLQIFLSHRESKIPGLILPTIAFLYGLLYPLNMIAPPEGVDAGFFVQMLIVWLLGNIPTIILLAIYSSCRGKHRRKEQMNKLNLQDLD